MSALDIINIKTFLWRGKGVVVYLTLARADKWSRLGRLSSSILTLPVLLLSSTSAAISTTTFMRWRLCLRSRRRGGRGL